MGRRLLAWWEGLAPRRQLQVAIPVMLVLLYAVHDLFFPLLSSRKALTYAVMECVPLALIVTWATQNELRRRQAAQDAELPDDAGRPPVDR